MSYGKFLILIVLCFAVATPYVMKQRNAQAEAEKLALYCKVAPEKARLDGVDCQTLTRKL